MHHSKPMQCRTVSVLLCQQARGRDCDRCMKPRARPTIEWGGPMPYRCNVLSKLLLALITLFGLQVPGANATTFDLQIDCSTCSALFPTLPTDIELTTSSGSNPYLITGISVGSLLAPGTFSALLGEPPGNDNLLDFPSSSSFDEQGLSFMIGLVTFNLFSETLGASYVWGWQFAVATFTVTEVTATPLPAALPLFSIGLGGLGLLPL
jgi:hypothetical protein